MGTEQDTPSGETGQSSGGKSGTTSKDKGKLYKDADIQKIILDAKSEAGRAQKKAEDERDATQQALQTTNTRLDTLEAQINESRLAEAREDPAQLQTYQREQTITKREREADTKDAGLKGREAQLKSDLEALTTNQGVVAIATLAAKHGLETEELESLGISDPVALEKVAEKLATAKSKGPEGEGEVEGEFTPDSGEGGGGGAKPLTTEGVAEMSTQDVDKALKKADETK